MNAIGGYFKNSYISLTAYQTMKKQGSTANRSGNDTSKTLEIKRMLSQSADNGQKNAGYENVARKGMSNSVLSSTLNYGDSLKAQRQNAKEASLEKKKVKYQFKSLSSKILRSKTSTAARQAVSQAKREVMRLKKERQSGKYDDEELEAAISHAKAMERVAKKKVNHLEQEELCKAAHGGEWSDEKEDWSKEEPASDEQEEEMAKATDQAPEAEQGDFEEEYEETPLEDMEALVASLEEYTGEVSEELAETMKEMLEELGLDELTDTFAVNPEETDPQELKMLKIKHRNKEMKDMVKADADYLKTIFEHMAKQAQQSVTATGGASFGAAHPPMGGSAPPTIDISL